MELNSTGASSTLTSLKQSFDSASRRRHLERSREISLAERSAHHLRYFDHRLLLIPNPSSLIPAFKLRLAQRFL